MLLEVFEWEKVRLDIPCELSAKHMKCSVLFSLKNNKKNLTLVLLNPDIPYLSNSVDPDQLASEEANWSGSVLFVIK